MSVPERVSADGERWAREARAIRSCCVGTDQRERRLSDRIPHEIPALFVRELGDPDIRTARVRDLSDGGACARTSVALPMDAVLYVGFFLQGSGDCPLIVKARVVWTGREGDDHVAGLVFLPDGAAQRESLERMRDYLDAVWRGLLANAGVGHGRENTDTMVSG